ncbi:MAG: hypothetical protein AAGF01_21910 [Cyanobacteria bacterium P01_G01_bin.38]
MMIASLNNLLTLHGQHTLQRDALLSIYRFANAEGNAESFESWHFEEVLGFTFHLFVTTKSSQIREQLSQLLPKFGSEAVRPLVKILNHFQSPSHLRKLTLQSLEEIAPYPLVIGLCQVLENGADGELGPIVIPILVNLMNGEDEAISWLLSQLLSAQKQQLLAVKSLKRQAHPNSQTDFDDEASLRLRVITNPDEPSAHPGQASHRVRRLSLCQSR